MSENHVDQGGLPRISGYKILSVLGEGGMGIVYLAHDDRLQRDVALKAVDPDLVQDEEDLTRLKREARLVAQLNNPHIAQIYDLLEHEGETYHFCCEACVDKFKEDPAAFLKEKLEEAVEGEMGTS